MTQVGEGISIGMPAVDDPDKCPICFKKAHETTKDKKKGKGELKSIPSNLGCEVIPQHPDVAFYATACLLQHSVAADFQHRMSLGSLWTLGR